MSRPFWQRLLSTWVLVGLLGASAMAQTPVTPPTSTEPPPSTSAAGLPLKALWFEILITGGMVGLVLFSVCRSSARR
ncbi:MAG: hypothetical protein KDA58_10910 [Planctomycetaceae bacterium]|nr:hypothetical protein [Planctomycetaceae bacterium]